MAGALNLLELGAGCAVCGARTDDLRVIEELDADTARGETPLATKLQALSSKAAPAGRICGGCVTRASDSWSFQQQLRSAQAEPSLSDKIRVLRQRLRELTQKIDVFIVIGPEKTDGQPVYTEDNIIMVDKKMLEDLEDEDGDTVKNESGERVYQCSVCPDSYPKLSEYMEHVRTHPPDAPHTCWTCGKQFGSRETLKTHRAQHLDMDKLSCKLCKQLFQGQVEMKRHACEPRCPACGELAADRAALAEHARAAHGAGGAPPHVCAICFETFDTADRLLAHVVKHRQTKQFVCGYDGCILRFPTRNNLMAHIRKMHAEAALECPEAGCGGSFASAEELRAHALSHSGVQCHICEKVLQTEAGLAKHMKVHTKKGGPGRGRKKLCVKRKTVTASDTSAAEPTGSVRKTESMSSVGPSVDPMDIVKTELVEEYQEIDIVQQPEGMEVGLEGEGEGEEHGGIEHHAVLIEQEQLADGEYQLECVEGDEMAVEMLEEEVEYLEVETLEEELEEDTKPDLAGL